MAAVTGRGVQVGAGLDAVGDHRGRLADIAGGVQDAFHVRGAISLGRQAGNADAHKSDAAIAIIAAGDAHGRADQGEAGGRLVQLLVRHAGALGFGRHDDLGHDLARLQRGSERIDQEIGEGQRALAARARQAYLGFQREERGGIVGGGIAMRHAAADGAHVAHLNVADVRGGLRQQGAVRAQHGRRFDLVVRGHGPDVDAVVRLANGVQTRNAAHVHDVLGRGEAQLHQRDEAHAAGQHFGAAIGQQREGGLQGGWRGVFEILGNHARPPA
jgi:hypothetical protein